MKLSGYVGAGEPWL
ncbi:unnamed protein product, partial [Rotaria sp. Silwood2]